jgi:hypothetical protein
VNKAGMTQHLGKFKDVLKKIDAEPPKAQAEYLGVPVEDSHKPDHYR